VVDTHFNTTVISNKFTSTFYIWKPSCVSESRGVVSLIPRFAGSCLPRVRDTGGRAVCLKVGDAYSLAVLGGLVVKPNRLTASLVTVKNTFIVVEIHYKNNVVDARGSEPVGAGRSLFVNK
jgi:hypothetical protein